MNIRRFKLNASEAPRSLRNNNINQLFRNFNVVSTYAGVLAAVKKTNLLTQTSLLLAMFIPSCLTAQAANTESTPGLSESRAESALVSVNPEEKNRLGNGQVVLGTADKPNGRRWVTAKVQIKANPATVWEAVHEERKTDPDLAYSKILEEEKNEITLEQKFQLLPIVGTSVCVIKSNEVPYKRIDYHLLKSDRFKAVEGSWILQPTADGGTILELGSFIDIGIPAPRAMVEGVAGRKLERRLTNVRKVAELNQHNKVANSRPEAPISN